MSKRTDPLLLSDIRESVRRILAATQGMHLSDFESNVIVQDAVVRNFEVIGEATKNLSGAFMSAHPSIDWKGMAGFRDVLIHSYFGIDLGVVWQIVQNDLPILERQLKVIEL